VANKQFYIKLLSYLFLCIFYTQICLYRVSY